MDLCIATINSTAPWLGPGQPPCIDNASIRKGLYRHFWKCIHNMGGWLIPQNLEKKKIVGGRDAAACDAPEGSHARLCYSL